MSNIKKFYAQNKHTKMYWQANPAYENQKLAILEDGKICVLTDKKNEGWSIVELGKDWIYNEIHTKPEEIDHKEVVKIKCNYCNGKGESMEIVDHDENYNSVWANRQCFNCNGTGFVIEK